MNDDKWAEISAEDQAAIEAISGEAFAALVGNAWNAADDAALIAIADAGIQVYDTPADVLEKIKTIAASYESEWADTIAADGFDGKAALAELRAQTGVEY
jgi:TRAP-type C4-dicarboxylate transport system substrate-binding protein